MDETEFYNRLEVEFNTTTPSQVWPKNKDCNRCAANTDQIDDIEIAEELCTLCRRDQQFF